MMDKHTIVLYDGHCAVCVNSTRWIRRIDRRRRIMLLDVQDPDVVSQFPALDMTALLGQIHVFDRHGTMTTGYAGLCTILAVLPGWRWLVPILRLAWIAWAGEKVYAFIAARRYRICRMLGWQTPCDDYCVH